MARVLGRRHRIPHPGVLVIVLLPHDPAWAGAARREAERFSRALEGVFETVHHIGSTSIPGIAAKPILDLLPVAHSLERLDEARTRIEALGYAWWGEYGLPGRRFATLTVEGARLVHVHAYERGSPELTRHLAFRDYLRAHPAIARGYDAKKERARSLHPEDLRAYSDEKSAFIRRIEAEAVAWAAHMVA